MQESVSSQLLLGAIPFALFSAHGYDLAFSSFSLRVWRTRPSYVDSAQGSRLQQTSSRRLGSEGEY
jgi:hypothetical protein